MKQAATFTLLLAACAVAGFLSFRFIAGTPPPALDEEAVELTGGMQFEDPPEHLPAFTLNDIEGQPRDIRDYLGRPMLLNFWATWCPPCLREMPLLDELHREHGDEVQVVGVAIDRVGPVVEFLDRLGIDYPVLVGEQDAMDAAEAFGNVSVGLPFTVYADADGTIVGVHLGELLREDMPPVRDALTALARGEIDADAARERLNGAAADR